MMMDKVKAEKAELIEKKENLEREVKEMGDDQILFKPYKLNEISDIDKEMKIITFEKMLESGEYCPEGLRPSYIEGDGRSFMEEYVKLAK